MLVSFGCSQVNMQLASTAISAGVTAGLRFGVQDSDKRAELANWLYVAAGAIRTISGTPTDAEFVAQINAFIPSKIKDNYPELLSMVLPLVVSLYHTARAKYGTNLEKIYGALDAIATSIEIGASSYRRTGQLAFNFSGVQVAYLR